MERLFEFVVDTCIIEMVLSLFVIQTIVPNVSLCKTRTYELQWQEQSVAQQISELVDIIINGEITMDLLTQEETEVIVLQVHQQVH